MLGLNKGIISPLFNQTLRMLGSGHCFFQLLAIVMSRIAIITTGLPVASELIEIGYAATGVPATLVVYLWNGVHTPRGRGNFGLNV